MHESTCIYACTHTHTHTYTVEYYSAIKKENGILPFVTTWMDLEGSVLVKQAKDKHHMLPIICGIKK